MWEADQQTTDAEQPEHAEPPAPATGTGEMETGAQAGRRGPHDSVDIGRNQSAAARGGAVLGWLLGFLIFGAVLLLNRLIDLPKEIERYLCLIPLVVAIATTWIFTSMQSRIDAQALQANCEDVLRRYEEGERDLAGVSLYRANLAGIDLRGASFRGAYLEAANLVGANLAGVDLSEGTLRNGDLREANLLGADLRNADLHKADLCGARLEEADLEGADLSWAKLHGAALSRANLRKADLLRASLCDADLRDVDLRGARLLRANLRGADWEGANREGADLDRAILPDGTKHE